MKERPILFSTPMVQAILDGRKTMTRRIVKHKISYEANRPGRTDLGAFGILDKHGNYVEVNEGAPASLLDGFCPYGYPGDVLWVREKWAAIHLGYDEAGNVDDISESTIDRVKNDITLFKPHDVFVYAADPHESHVDDRGWKWKPSIHMPKAACRIRLEVVNVRIERLQDITEQDAIAEGIEMECYYDGGNIYEFDSGGKHKGIVNLYGANFKTGFRALWQSINGIDSWDNNPWVWVVEFKQHNTASK